jgi:hypothetical protein
MEIRKQRATQTVTEERANNEFREPGIASKQQEKQQTRHAWMRTEKAKHAEESYITCWTHEEGKYDKNRKPSPDKQANRKTMKKASKKVV